MAIEADPGNGTIPGRGSLALSAAGAALSAIPIRNRPNDEPTY